MKFSYETQGAITYLVCELDATEQLDNLTLGMLTNNHIAGLASVLYTEMNGQQFIKYNISAKVSSDQFFSGSMNRQRTLTSFQNILEALCSADEYMIDKNCFSMQPEHVFLNVSSCEVSLVCIPAVIDKDITPDIISFFKKIMFSTQFDPNEDAGYITKLITYINGANFSIYGMKELVTELQSGASGAMNAPAQQTAGFQAPQPQAHPISAPVSSFDSTITMEEMPAMMAAKQAAQGQPIQQPPAQKPFTPPTAPARPVQPTQPQTQQPQSTAPAGRPINRGYSNPQQTPVSSRPAVPNNPNFAIPGQPAVNTSKPQPSVAPVKTQQPKASGEKKMSFFGLLANYSKENAELYKKQKEEAKKAKGDAATAKKSNKTAQPVVPNGNQRGGMPAQGQIYTPPQQVQQQFVPKVQPVPVQNSFNETTVLGPLSEGIGETTVLGTTAPDPIITRVKTGERININKPVFRIGKEKSYVDYFIADNTAISRSHANIHTENGEYFIEDTNSTNHTYVNGTLINSNVKTKLKNGDKVRLANEDFTFTV